MLEVALTHFGCCSADHAEMLARVHHPRPAVTPAGHAIQVVAFGDIHVDGRQRPWLTVPTGHVVEYLRGYLREHWSALRHAQVQDPAFAALELIEKWGVGHSL